MKRLVISASLGSFLLLSACTGTSTKAEVLKLKYDASMTVPSPNKVPPAKGAPKVTAAPGATETVQETMDISLGTSAFSVSSDGKTTIYDFKDKRISNLHNKTNTFEQMSLYVVAGFKEPEMRNRVMLKKVVEKSGADAKVFDPYDIACELSMSFPGEPDNPGITVKDEAGTVKFYRKGECVAEAELGADMPQEYVPMAEKFFVYRCNLHPFIRKDLQSRKKILKHLHYVVQSMGSKKIIDMKLVDSSVLPEKLEIPSGFKRSFSDKSPLHSMQEKLLTSTNAPVLPTLQAFFDQANGYRKNNDQVDAFLTMLEYNLITGDRPDSQNKEIFSTALKDPTVQLIVQNIEPQTAEGAKASLIKLESIDTKKFEKGYLLEVLKGNILSLLGGDASGRFLKALNVNPLIVGVYKDLGSVFYSRFDSGHAWESWELARKIKPDHPMLADVAKIEKGLETGAPEYFVY